MKTMVFRGSLTVAMSCLTAGLLLAQQPPPSRPDPSPTTPQAPASSPRADQDRAQTVTATGCLKQEKDVPGGRPNIAERAGLGEDFILTEAKITHGTREADPSGRKAMYKIVGLDDEKLRAHVNQQVEVQGRLEDRTAITGARKPTTPGPGTAPDEVQAIRAESVRMLNTTCKTGTN